MSDDVLRNTYRTVLRVINTTVDDPDLRESVYANLDACFPELHDDSEDVWQEGLRRWQAIR